MDALFSTETQAWLRLKETYLFMLICGAKPLTEEGYSYLQSLVTRYVFLCFSASF